MQNLTVRLEMVLEQVRAACKDPVPGRVIDVGSDHGYIAVRCLEEEIASSVICTEIHRGPAQRSEDALVEAGFEDRSEVYVTDGLKGVPLMNGDIVVIAGMGGLNIIDIISRALKDNGYHILENVTFVLQPQKSNEIVRNYLAKTGFVFEDESICYDRDIFYNCLRVVFKGICTALTDEEACYGPVLLRKYSEGDKETADYFGHLNSLFEIRQRSNPVIRSALEERKRNECQ
ncbi:MAG: SAM-dependent methyltransferase [Clostridiales bacterium]|nr:SAM-dependent methyltransferase [Clostridiales bacterium]